MTVSSQECPIVLQHFEEGLKCETKRVLISFSPMNEAAPIEIVMSDFLEYPKLLLHLIFYVIKVLKPKENRDYHAVVMATTVRKFAARSTISHF